VVNGKAGTLRRLKLAKERALFEERLQGQLVSMRIVKPAAIPAALDEALAQHPDAILVLGGDGTARSAAAQLLPKGVPAAFLPGGTMNILPKRLYGEAGIETILDAIAKGNVTEVHLPTGLAGSEPFFVAVTFGFLPHFASVREQLRRARTIGERAQALQHMVRFGARYFEKPVGFMLPDANLRLTSGLAVGLGNLDTLHPLRAPEDPLDRFECASLDVPNWRALAALSLNALVRADWRKDARVESFTTRMLTVYGGRRVRLTLDGEPHRLEGPVQLRMAKQGVLALALPAVLDTGALNVSHRASV
jgi:diacylglycerol kinase family enzyme